MNLAFMSWVCPDWDLSRIADFAEHGPYDGVEFRVNVGHAHEISTDTPPARRREIAADFSRRGIEIPAVATGHRLAVDDPEQVEGARATSRAISALTIFGSSPVGTTSRSPTRLPARPPTP